MMNIEVAPEFIYFVFIATCWALDAVLKRHPWLSIALGTGFLAVAALVGVYLSGDDYLGGLGIVVVVMFFFTPALFVGLWFLGFGILRLCGFYPVDPDPSPSRRLKDKLAAAVLVAVGVGIAGSLLYRVLDLGGDSSSRKGLANEEGLADEGRAFRLSWGATLWTAPALELVLTAADLRPDGRLSHFSFASAPSQLSLRIVEGDAAGTTLTLYRKPPERAVAGQETSMWFSTENGRWKLLGVDCADRMLKAIADAGVEVPRCHSPPSRLARYFPGRHGLERVSLRSEDERHGCRAMFKFRGRHAVLESDSACLTARSWQAFRSAVALLDRAALDALLLPDSPLLHARALAAVANCEGVSQAAAQLAESVARERVSLACGYAGQLVATLPREHAAGAAALAGRVERASLAR